MLTGEAEILSQPKIPDLKIDTLSYALTAKENPLDKISVEIGDSKDLTQFQPQVKVMRWDNEVNFSARLISDAKVDEVITQEDEKIIWEKGNISANFYDLPISEEHPEGAMEFEVILKEKPKTNVVEFTLQDKDVEYYYQPEISDEEAQIEIDRRKFRPDGFTDEEYKQYCPIIPTLTEMKRIMRPENVVGSYVVYAKNPKINRMGGKEYKTGKIGHIYRPKIIDSRGLETWGELNIENGILSVTIPQEFLDKAVYPVRHAAGLTFGFDTAGASTVTAYVSCCPYYYNPTVGNVYTTPAAGTITAITGYLSNSAGTNGKASFGFYEKDSNGANSHNLRDHSDLLFTVDASAGWREKDVTHDWGFANADDYIIAAKATIYGASSGAVSLYYDNVSSTSSVITDSSGTDYSLPETLSATPTTGTVPKFSIYATYTAGASSAIKTVNTLAKASVKTINGLAIASVKTWDGLV